MSALLENPGIEHEASEQRASWEIATSIDYSEALGQLRDRCFELMNKESATTWSWVATELVVNEIKHGWGLKETVDTSSWSLPNEASPITVSIQIAPSAVELIVDSAGTMIPRETLAKSFDISEPTTILGADGKEAVFVCKPKTAEALPEITLEELMSEHGRGYRTTALYLDQPADQMELRFDQQQLMSHGSWPEGKRIPHTVIVKGARDRAAQPRADVNETALAA